LGVSRSQVYALIKLGELTPVPLRGAGKDGMMRKTRFRRSDNRHSSPRDWRMITQETRMGQVVGLLKFSMGYELGDLGPVNR
jgi:hypothetical protein